MLSSRGVRDSFVGDPQAMEIPRALGEGFGLTIALFAQQSLRAWVWAKVEVSWHRLTLGSLLAAWLCPFGRWVGTKDPCIRRCAPSLTVASAAQMLNIAAGRPMSDDLVKQVRCNNGGYGRGRGPMISLAPPRRSP